MSLLSCFFPQTGPTFAIRYKGHRFQIPRRAGGDYILQKMEKDRSFYEADLLAPLSRLCPPDKLALDCGANIGNHALFFAGVMGCPTIAFEPVEDNRTVLGDVIALNDLQDRITVEPLALGDREGTVQLGLPNPSNPGMYRVTQSAERAAATARLTTLDTYLQEAGHPPQSVGLIKIDVEGFEIPVIQGATGLLSQGQPVLAVEIMGRAALEEMYDLLAPLGYHPHESHCHTPTVIFLKSDPHQRRIAKVRKAQDAFDKREARR